MNVETISMRQHLLNGDIDAAILKSEQIINEEAYQGFNRRFFLVNASYARAKIDYTNGLLSDDGFEVRRAQITHKILLILDDIDAKSSSTNQNQEAPIGITTIKVVGLNGYLDPMKINFRVNGKTITQNKPGEYELKILNRSPSISILISYPGYDSYSMRFKPTEVDINKCKIILLQRIPPPPLSPPSRKTRKGKHKTNQSNKK